MRSINATERVVGVAVAGAVLLGVSVPARADTSSENAALAETLFRDGKELMAEKRFDLACPKLAESNRLDPATGTLLALALCHEGGGLLATAWVEFTDVLAATADTRPDRALVARDHIAQIEPTLSRLTVTVPAAVAAIPGLEVLRDGVPLDRSAWGVAAPVDGGPHAIVARAPGRRDWSAQLSVATARQRSVVEVPPLAPESAPPAGATAVAAATPPPEASSKPATFAWGIGVAALGVVGLGTGAYFGFTAISDIHSAKAQCPAAPACASPTPVNTNAEGMRDATIADAALGVGVAASAVGLFLILTGRPRATEALHVSPSLARSGGGLDVAGEF